MPLNPHVLAVAAGTEHRFSKAVLPTIRLLAGLGVEGDAHAGVTVRHRSRVARDPSSPNLRQVHLIYGELLDELVRRGFRVEAGDLGENILTRGIDLLGLATDTRLRIGADAVVRVTGLRNPCRQIEEFQRGLLAATLEQRADGSLVRKAGVMGVVEQGGMVRAGDAIIADAPGGPGAPLVCV